jgi:cell filamentation protein
MAAKPGEVMGFFAYGHPFLDGRTMLLVHVELCHRAGFSIEWHRTNKTHYLAALGILDRYLLQFKGRRQKRSAWARAFSR